MLWLVMANSKGKKKPAEGRLRERGGRLAGRNIDRDRAVVPGRAGPIREKLFHGPAVFASAGRAEEKQGSVVPVAAAAAAGAAAGTAAGIGAADALFAALFCLVNVEGGGQNNGGDETAGNEVGHHAALTPFRAYSLASERSVRRHSQVRMRAKTATAARPGTAPGPKEPVVARVPNW